MKTYRLDPYSYKGLDALGRIPLSRHFHMREFLYSEIAVHYGLRNVPTDLDRVVWAGSMLCEKLLEPLQEHFGRVHVRSGYRSREVNQTGVRKHNCAQDNDGAHTWDFPSLKHGYGAMASVSAPGISRAVLSGEVDVAAVAWWIVDHLPGWSVIEFFATPKDVPFADEVVFNIGWNEKPQGVIINWRGGARLLHKQMPDEAERARQWAGLESVCLSPSP